MPGKHGWNDRDNYLHVVVRVLDSHPFVVDHDLVVEPEHSGLGEIEGHIYCHGEIVLEVLKFYEVKQLSGRTVARTKKYSYHAGYLDGRRILRYDNADHHGLPTPHHKHLFESRPIEDEEGLVVHVGNSWPHLSEVLDELQQMVWPG